MTSNTRMYRHGDVLMVEVDRLAHSEPIPADNGRCVLAYGEVTGHAHVLPARDADAVGVNGVRTGVHIKTDTSITHEEHAAIRLPASLYVLPQQVEEGPEAIRRVVD